jgi:hypothetical protein
LGRRNLSLLRCGHTCTCLGQGAVWIEGAIRLGVGIIFLALAVQVAG